eukprot:362038-Chlamydomonas_euryale.AAC.4
MAAQQLAQQQQQASNIESLSAQVRPRWGGAGEGGGSVRRDRYEHGSPCNVCMQHHGMHELMGTCALRVCVHAVAQHNADPQPR